MKFLQKFLRQFAPKENDTLDDDLRKILKRLPDDTKRNLLDEYGPLSASAKGLAPERPVFERGFTAPGFAPVYHEVPEVMSGSSTGALLLWDNGRLRLLYPNFREVLAVFCPCRGNGVRVAVVCLPDFQRLWPGSIDQELVTKNYGRIVDPVLFSNRRRLT